MSYSSVNAPMEILEFEGARLSSLLLSQSKIVSQEVLAHRSDFYEYRYEEVFMKIGEGNMCTKVSATCK